MPCGKVPRGVAATVSLPGFATPSAQPMPFNDAIQNNPCGQRIISTANGVSFASHSLCLTHLQAKLGTQGIAPPYVDAA